MNDNDGCILNGNNIWNNLLICQVYFYFVINEENLRKFFFKLTYSNVK